ncbi:cobalamin-binding protein [Niveibacterium terrae]|uniref:cobalamin-binding protein n=1 Tax=Niveibacterium terrae TaxID=3373598 RepID=UPI003A8E251E
MPQSSLRSIAIWLATSLSLISSGPALAAPITVRDDSGQTVHLASAARRIISLSPHATELLYAAGAGERLIAVSAYSDWPAAARKLPSVGSYQALDLERIASLHPDLVVGWASGNPQPQIARLRALGIPVFLSEPRQIGQIAANLRTLSRLTGSAVAGEAAAKRFEAQITALQSRYSGRRTVKVFYEIWPQPLMTLNGQHMVSAAITLCGGENVFASLGPLAPTISQEAVLKARPELILTPSEAGQASAQALAEWKRWPQLPAVRYRNLASVDGNLLNRSGPRFADGAEQLCVALEAARQRLP